MTKFSNRDIADYYNQTLVHYKKWWKLDAALSVHYGMWDENTRNLAEALVNTNRILTELAGINSGERILDAGCGVGGSAFFLAREKKARVSGITLSEKQIEYARQKNEELGFTSLVDFKLEDYTNTSFKSSTFDLIWAIESLTSAPDKKRFATEAFRILKPNGKLIIADYFKNSKAIEDKENMLTKWQNCWSLAEIQKEKPYIALFEQEKFKLIKNQDVTKNIYPTAKIMYRSYLLGAFPSMIYNTFHNTSRFAKTHYLSGKYQYKALRKKLWNYRLLLFEKQSD